MVFKRVLKCLSFKEIYKLYKKVEGGLKKKEAADKYGIPAATVSKFFENKESITNSFEFGFQKLKILISVSNTLQIASK